jgi:hypothetical protein
MGITRNWDSISDRLKNEATSNGYADADKRLYRPKLAKDGTFSALIRFLPAPGDELPMVKQFAHQYKDKNGELKEECPTTLGLQCPICEKNREIWNTDEDTARMRSRNKSAIANILVISDPQIPANNGKVFLYRFGKKILDKVNEKCFPDDKQISTGKKPVNIFDYFAGCDFRINAKKVLAKNGKPYPDYSSSEFDTPSPLGKGPNHPNGDEALMEAIDKQLYSLKEFTEPTRIKPYSKLLELFNKASGVVGPAAAPAVPAATVPAPAAAPTVPPAPAQPPANAAPAPAVQAEAAPAAQPAPQMAAPAVQSPPYATPQSTPMEASMDFDAVEGQSEDEFWSSIKKDQKK